MYQNKMPYKLFINIINFKIKMLRKLYSRRFLLASFFKIEFLKFVFDKLLHHKIISTQHQNENLICFFVLTLSLKK